MHLIVITSYLIAAAAFLAGTALLTAGWRGQRTGALLILATMVSVLWSAFLAYAEWRRTVAINWVLMAEVLRYGAWLVFLSALFGAWPMSGLLRGLRVRSDAQATQQAGHWPGAEQGAQENKPDAVA